MSSTAGLTVTRQGIRRFLLEAQDLLGDHHYRPAAVATSGQVLREIRRLEAVQLDPVAAVERNQHLVLAARVPGYTPALLERLLAQRRIFEYWGHAACAFPIEDYPIFEHKRRQVRRRLRAELNKVRSVTRAVLARLEREGPLPARAFTSEQRVHGWWDIKGPRTKVTSHALNLLSYVGQVMVSRREGLERHFDLPERVVPAKLLRRAREIDPQEADQALLMTYMRAHRIFDLDYTWEVYVPPAKRAYGYYTMPILAGDRFIGRFDPRLDRESGRLVINLLHLERGVQATARLRTALEDALHAFARFHGASELRIVRSRPVRLLS